MLKLINKNPQHFKRIHFLGFLGLFVLVCLYFNIHQTIFYPPSANHSWRQADVASITLNYYQNGFEFGNQEVHCNELVEGRKLTEAPILYYGIALLYKIFGANDWVFRGVSLLIVFLGFFAFSRLTFQIVKDTFVALCLPLLFFASPTVAFYSPNFLPNMSAFGLMWIGLYFMYQYVLSRRLVFHYVSILFFLFAGLLKVSSMIAVIAIFGIYVLEIFNFKIFQTEPKMFSSKWKPLPAFLFLFGGVYAWLSETPDYGPLQPIWNMDGDYINKTLTFITEESIPFLLSTPMLILFLILFAEVLLSPKRLGLKIYTFNWMIFLGVTAMFFFIFKPLFINDYYFIEFLILPITIFFTAIYFFGKKYPLILKNKYFRIALAALLIFNIQYTKVELGKRYDTNGSNFHQYNANFLNKNEIQDFLKTNGITYPDSVITAPDVSPNLSLYIMNLKGWSEFPSGYNSLQLKRIKGLAKLGTKYFIVHDKVYLERENLQSVFTNPIANYKNSIFIFDITHLRMEN